MEPVSPNPHGTPFLRVAALLVFALVITVLSSLGTYWYMGKQLSSQQTQQQTYQPSPTIESQVLVSPTINSNKASLLSDSIHIILPSGWSKLDDFSVIKNLNGKKYRSLFQLNDQDYLERGGAYSQELTLIKNVKTLKGTSLYVIKSDSNVYVSSCQPTKDSACSIKVGGKFLFIILHISQPGDQYPRELDFSNQDTNKIISEFIQIVESSDI